MVIESLSFYTSDLSKTDDLVSSIILILIVWLFANSIFLISSARPYSFRRISDGPSVKSWLTAGAGMR